MALLARAAERKVISTDHLTGKVTTGWEQIERPPSGVQAAVDFGPQVGSLTPLQIDADWPAYQAKLHRLAKPDYSAVFWKWLHASARARPARLEHGWASSEVVGWHTLERDEQKALNEGMDPSGGVLVPPSFAEQIMARLPESNLIVLATVRTDVQRDLLLVPRVQPSQTSGMASIYSGSFEVSPVGETPSQSDFDPLYGANAISMRKFRCRTRISNDLLADAGPNFQAEIARLAAADLAPAAAVPRERQLHLQRERRGRAGRADQRRRPSGTPVLARRPGLPARAPRVPPDQPHAAQRPGGQRRCLWRPEAGVHGRHAPGSVDSAGHRDVR